MADTELQNDCIIFGLGLSSIFECVLNTITKNACVKKHLDALFVGCGLKQKS